MYLKRESINLLVKKYRFTEDELKNLMVLYTAFAKPKQGLNSERLGNLLEVLMNFRSPLLNEIFMLFD